MHILGDESCYHQKWTGPNLRKLCLPTFAGKLDCGFVGAMSATDLPMGPYIPPPDIQVSRVPVPQN